VLVVNAAKKVINQPVKVGKQAAAIQLRRGDCFDMVAGGSTSTTIRACNQPHDWKKVITRTEAILNEFTSAYSATGGLMSDFVVNADTTSPKPAPAAYQENQPDNIVGYNSIRVPWHLGTDALLCGGTAATSVAIATKESACLKGESGGNPQHVYPHTNLNCTPYSTSDTAEEAGDSVGPAAMAAGDQAWTDTIWNYLATNPFGDGYYGETIKTLVTIVMAGDYWNPGSGGTVTNDFSVPASPASVRWSRAALRRRRSRRP
jgi:hypothetical protein